VGAAAGSSTPPPGALPPTSSSGAAGTLSASLVGPFIITTPATVAGGKNQANQLSLDQRSYAGAVAAVKNWARVTEAADRAAISAARAKLGHDSGRSSTSAADQASLLASLTKLRSDIVAAAARIAEDRQAFLAMFKADRGITRSK
jgi:hypothetical protein